MARFVFLAFIAIILSVTLQQAFALKCWNCGGTSQPNCPNPFDEKKLDEKTTYLECVPVLKEKAQCIKVTVENHVARGCAPSEKGFEESCEMLKNVKKGSTDLANKLLNTNAKVDANCDKCDSDGCNGASEYGPVAMMIAIPVIIMKITSL